MAHHEVEELPFLEAYEERVIHGAEIYVAGESDRIASGRTLTIKKSANHHWVGRIDTDLRDYVDIRLEVRFPATSSAAEFAVGPRVRDETLVSGLGPAPC